MIDVSGKGETIRVSVILHIVFEIYYHIAICDWTLVK